MRGLPSASSTLRLGLIGLAAFLSLATSEEFDEVVATVPPPLESAVALELAPGVRLSSPVALDGAPASAVQLRTAAGEAVAGYAEQRSDGLLRFVPDAGLAADTDYELVIEGLLGGYGYADRVTNTSVIFGERGVPDRLRLPFTTRAAPIVRSARRRVGTPTVIASFSHDMAPLSLSTNTVRVLSDGDDGAAELVLYRGGELHQVEITLLQPGAAEVELVFGSGVEAADGTPVAAPLIVPVEDL